MFFIFDNLSSVIIANHLINTYYITRQKTEHLFNLEKELNRCHFP